MRPSPSGPATSRGTRRRHVLTFKCRPEESTPVSCRRAPRRSQSPLPYLDHNATWRAPKPSRLASMSNTVTSLSIARTSSPPGTTGRVQRSGQRCDRSRYTTARTERTRAPMSFSWSRNTASVDRSKSVACSTACCATLASRRRRRPASVIVEWSIRSSSAPVPRVTRPVRSSHFSIRESVAESRWSRVPSSRSTIVSCSHNTSITTYWL